MAKIPAINEARPQIIAQFIRDLFAGRSNAVGTCTLAASETSTAVIAPNCGADSKVFLMPTSASAAAAVAAVYISAVIGGGFTITHDSDAAEDRSFFWVALG
jgi:hypothetical protein